MAAKILFHFIVLLTGCGSIDFRNIIDVFHCRPNANRELFFPELGGNAVKRLDAAFYMADVVSRINHLELIVQNFKLE